MGVLSRLFGSGDGGPASVKGVSKSVLTDKIRQCELFKHLPAEYMDRMFGHMETVELRSGDLVIGEGAEGDYYYLLVKGSARVTKKDSNGSQQQVAILDGPAGFGEEALISNAKRNASIAMTSDGTLMRLSKESFNDDVKEPLVEWFSPKEAQDKVAAGARWIDVRDAEEARQAHLHGALSIPMAELRDRLSELDTKVLYICYCQNARLSSTAAFLLRQRGYNVGVLRGGLQSLQRAGIT